MWPKKYTRSPFGPTWVLSLIIVWLCDSSLPLLENYLLLAIASVEMYNISGYLNAVKTIKFAMKYSVIQKYTQTYHKDSNTKPRAFFLILTRTMWSLPAYNFGSQNIKIILCRGNDSTFHIKFNFILLPIVITGKEHLKCKVN